MTHEKIVVVGAGGIFNAWAPHIIREELELAAVVDIDPDGARRRLQASGIACEVSDDLARTLQRVAPSFVIDLTVPEAHADVTCAALEAGCHVLGEKPMASSMEAARRMVATAAKTGKLYMVSQSRRWLPQPMACAAALQAKLVGDLTVIDCDFRIGAHFAGFRAAMESPLVLDMAIHHFDLARMMSGCDPVAVYAHEFNPKGSWYRGNAAAVCVFEMTDNVVFTYRGNWCAEGFQTCWNGDWQFTCTQGGINYQQGQPAQATRPLDQADRLTYDRQEVPVPAVPVNPSEMGGALAEMLRFIRSGEPPQTECHDNIKSLAMVFAAMRSARAGQRVKVEW